MHDVCTTYTYHGHPLLPPWCERGDSNPHTFRRQNLNLVRLPIPPLSRCFSDSYNVPREYQTNYTYFSPRTAAYAEEPDEPGRSA
jgi:hypothetical protein